MARSQMTPLAKIVIATVAVVVLIFGLRTAASHGLIPTPGILKAVVPTSVQLPPAEESKIPDVKPLPIPEATVAHSTATPIRGEIWEWNAYSALIYANGGASTTKGSLMEKYNVNLNLFRQDSNDQMKSDLLACAKQLHDGDKACSNGANFIVVMGDSAGQWFADLNPQLKNLGDQLIEIGAVGFSYGEDGLLGPAAWKDNPQSAKGGVTVGVIRDGDWNIALKWLGDNGIKNNPDLKTYDPEAMNWIAAPDDDYIKAVTEVFNTNRCEDRPVVKNGAKTGETKHICPDGVVTWTPGDEQAVHGRGGVVKVVSSHEYSTQMPATIFILKSFANNNRDEINGMLAATFAAADQLKAFDTSLKKAASISAQVYKDQDANYWYKYFKGFKENGVPLGGSRVVDLQENMVLFGLVPGHLNAMKSVYTTFANIDTQQYPDLFAKNPIPPYNSVVDTSYISGAQGLLSGEGIQPIETAKVDYSQQANSGTVVSSRAYHVNFATGSAQPLPDGIAELNKLAQSAAMTSLAVKVDGYTDNTGSEPVNQSLSQMRAQAVRSYLQQIASDDFPDSRFASISGHGSQDPVATNATADGKAKNRRVQITLIGK